MRRWLPLVVAVALAGAACSSSSARSVSTASTTPPSSVAPSTSTNTGAPRTSTTAGTVPAPPTTVAQVREYSVAQHEETYVDTTRPTPPNGSYRGAPSRTLTVS